MAPRADKHEVETVRPNGATTDFVQMSHSKTKGSALVPVGAQEHYESKGWKIDTSEATEPTGGPAPDEKPEGSSAAPASTPSHAGGDSAPTE